MKQNSIGLKEYRALAKGTKRRKTEANLQVQVCAYIKTKYKDVIFQCDLASGMNLGKHIGGMNSRLRSSRGLPDLFVAKAKCEHLNYDKNGNGGSFKVFYGLFIELKREDIRLKNGNIARTDHIYEQQMILLRLQKIGYKAEFACGLEEAIKIIDEYLGE